MALGSILGFGKGFVQGLGEGGKALIEGAVDLGQATWDVAKGGYQIAKDPEFRKAVWSEASERAQNAKEAASQIHDYYATVSKEQFAADARQTWLAARDGANRALTAFDKARQAAAARGESGEFYGKIAGRGGFEVAALFVPVGAATKVAGSARAAKLAEATSTASKARAVVQDAAKIADVGAEVLPCGKINRGRVAISSGKKGQWSKELNLKNLKPNTDYYVNSYKYATDAKGRVISVEGRLDLGGDVRNAYQQKVAGRADRLAEDEGGHLIASIFNGPGDRINLVPMDGNLNKGAWKKLENKFANMLQNGNQVDIKIDLIYNNNGRPDQFVIKYKIDGGRPVTVEFDNVAGGKK